MQKFTHFIYLVGVIFFSLFMSACQDKQKEVESELEEELEFSCLAKRIEKYDKVLGFTYRKIKYNQGKKVLSDSTFKSENDLLIRVENNTYDNQNRILTSNVYEHLNGSFSLRYKRENSYNGNTRIEKRFNQSNTGELFKSNEIFYNQNKTEKIIYYESTTGNTLYEQVYTYNGELISKIETIVDGNVQGSIKYEYEGTTLVKREHYENGMLTRYYTYSKENNTETSTEYDIEGNQISQSITKHDSYGNITYNKWSNEQYYWESTTTYQYNEHGFILSEIWESGSYTHEGIQVGIGYSKTEYKEIECY